eukprot:m.209121 g.209121  ORF g.209121 m.209121 type:complete len:84 (+) comp53941_c0_seq2:666-917(+)
MANPLLDHQYDLDTNSLVGVNRVIVPFLACGDLSAFDSDKTYPLELSGPGSYTWHAPVQQPIDPPYKVLCQVFLALAGLFVCC